MRSPLESPKEAVCRVLGAIKSKSENESTATLAIPWPKDFPYSSNEAQTNGPESDQNDVKSPAKPKPLCIQVDIHICATLEHLQWMLFKHAHGDLWNLLGTTIRPCGLTIDEVGLYVRIPEVEEFDKKKAKVLLSTEPAEILRFLGLRFDDKQWEEPFGSDEAVFEYAATCRLFWAKTKDASNDNGDEEKEKEGSGAAVGADKRKLKSNDRRRMAFRPLFRKWVDEYLPACRASGRFATAPPTRDEVREQAFAYFAGTASTYAAQAREWRIGRQQATLWRDVIKPAVPESGLDVNRRSCTTAALKKIILQGDEVGGIVAPPTLRCRDDDDDDDGLFDEAAVRLWVEANWRRVMDVAWAINQQRYKESVKLKGAAKRTR